MTKLLYVTFGLFLGAAPVTASETTPTQRLMGLLPVQYNECSQRVGPFATQDTAWARRRDAQAQGYPVSNGVVPCLGDGGEGYCFFVFYAC